MRRASDAYFVRLDPGPPSVGADPRARRGHEPEAPRPRRPRRRSFSGRRVFLALVLVGLGGWTWWASQRPGGVSGTVNGWIEHVRGDVASVSADPDLAQARTYYQDQYKKTGAYPVMSESDLAGVGVGVGVTVQYCSSQAVVLQGSAGGGTSSRLLLGGQDLGELPAVYGCPANLSNPQPWQRKR